MSQTHRISIAASLCTLSGVFQFRAVARYARGAFRASAPSALHNAAEWHAGAASVANAGAAGGSGVEQSGAPSSSRTSAAHPMTASAARVEPLLAEYDAAAAADQLAESLLGTPISPELRAPAFQLERGNASIAVHFSHEAR